MLVEYKVHLVGNSQGQKKRSGFWAGFRFGRPYSETSRITVIPFKCHNKLEYVLFEYNKDTPNEPYF